MNNLFGIEVGTTTCGSTIKAAIRFHHITREPDRKTTCYVSLFYSDLLPIELNMPYPTEKALARRQVKAETKVHANDKFVKETGRKLALDRVLKSQEFIKLLEETVGYDVNVKRVRSILWHAYFNRRNVCQPILTT